MLSIIRSVPRPINFELNINPYALGSVICSFGQTKVHITVNYQKKVPPFLENKKEGWLTAEYAMLPGATHTRSERERKHPSGRTQEIQRLIGRCLRSIVDRKKLGEITILVDCDVLVADGGTRTTSLNGAYVALSLAIANLMKQGIIQENPLLDSLQAISVGVNSKDEVMADLNYAEDSSCQVDFNLVMTGKGKWIELQGASEGTPFAPEALEKIIVCGQSALKIVATRQQEILNLK